MTYTTVLRLALVLLGVPLVGVAAGVAFAAGGAVATAAVVASTVLGITAGLALAPPGARR